MFIKICANTNLHDAMLAAELGANAVGFVFAPSKRRVTCAEVRAMASGLPVGVERVGVFAEPDAGEIAFTVDDANLTAAQLHCAFDADFVRVLAASCEGLKIIQTISCPVDASDRAAADESFAKTLRAACDEPAVWALLIDAAKSGASGGLGVAFDWKHVATVIDHAIGSRTPRPRLILAGGLQPHNVAEAIATLHPWGVDVASGVETAPGKKDEDRLRAFIAEARKAQTR